MKSSLQVLYMFPIAFEEDHRNLPIKKATWGLACQELCKNIFDISDVSEQLWVLHLYGGFLQIRKINGSAGIKGNLVHKTLSPLLAKLQQHQEKLLILLSSDMQYIEV